MASSAQDSGVLLRYARALYELAAQAGEVGRVESDLDVLSQTIGGNQELRIHLESPRLTRESKKRLLAGVLGSNVSDLVQRTVMLLVDKGRAALLGGLGPVYGGVAMEATGRMVARVTSAAPLEDAQRSRLVSELQALTSKTITLDESVDPDLLAGIRIVLGSRMIDGSLRRRLESLGDSLIRAPVGAAND